MTRSSMIKLTRIDDRLLHGQVAFTWTPSLGVDTLLIANDKVAKDEFMKMTMGLAKPAGARLLIKSLEGAADLLCDAKSANLKILVLVNSVKDAHALAADVPDITSLNFGGIRTREGARLVSKAVALTDDDISLIKEMLEKGIELEIRQVPTDSRQLVKELL